MKKAIISLLSIVAFSSGIATAQTTFEAYLSGLEEAPPNASPGSGYATLVLNAAQTHFTLDANWSGLLAPATASHIHGPGGAGTNAPVLFGLSGVPAATAGAIPTQSFSISPVQVGYLFSGYLYVNVHTTVFPGGEIRGQLQLVPEPSAAALFVLGVAATAWNSRRKGKS